jgi:hypothetical protein
MFFNAMHFARTIPVSAFVFGSVINFIVIGAVSVALRNAYRQRQPPQPTEIASRSFGAGLQGYLITCLVPVLLAAFFLIAFFIFSVFERVRLILYSFGFVLGCLISVVFFCRPSFMIIAAAPPVHS